MYAYVKKSVLFYLTDDLLALLCPELLGAVVKQLLVHFHEELQSVVDQAMDGPEDSQELPQLSGLIYLVYLSQAIITHSDSLIPVGFGIAVEGWEHDWEDFGSIVTDQAHDVLVVPVVKSSLRYLHDTVVY